MDFGPTADEVKAFTFRNDISVGEAWTDRRPRLPATISDAALYQKFVELVQREPEYGWRAGEALGLDTFKRPTRPLPMPMKGIVSVEASFGDRGPSKAKRQRKDQERARFDAQIQVCTTKSRGVSNPIFRGRVDFYSPDRALQKAVQLSSPTKCLTPFSAEYVELVQAVVATIDPDMMVGFLHTKSQADGGGTVYHDCQIVLADRAGLEAHRIERVTILLADQHGSRMIHLPASARTTSKGNALNGKFKHQSRGVVSAGYYDEPWETGLLTMPS